MSTGMWQEYLLVGLAVNVLFLAYSAASSRFSWFDLFALLLLVPVWPVVGMAWMHLALRWPHGGRKS